MSLLNKAYERVLLLDQAGGALALNRWLSCGSMVAYTLFIRYELQSMGR